MLTFFCKKLRPVHGFVSGSWDIHLCNVQNASPIKKFFSSESFVSEDKHQQQLLLSLAVAPCISNNNPSTCAPEIDSSSSKKVHNAELVKTLLRDYGFADTQISKMVNVRPKILSSDPQKTILPKLNFFCSIGLSSTDLPKIFCASHCQAILSASLENQLIPCYNFLKSVLLRDEIVVKMLKRRPRILLHNVEKKIAPNIAALRGAGVPQSVISFLLCRFPSTLYQDCHKLKEGMNKAIEMGFNPMRSTFAHAVQVLCEMRKTTWEHKMDVYGRCGLSSDEIMLAFRSHPSCMNLSEGKIMETMGFLVNKMGWQPADVARRPAVLFFNLERRIIPRCAVIKLLLADGLVKKDLSLGTFLLPGEKVFLDRFVNKYQDDVPGLMNIYLGKMGNQD